MEQLAWDIGETSLAIRRAFDRKAATLGITRAQWRVLARLDHQPGQKQVELADRMDIEPITLCRIVDKLEEAGLVERRGLAADLLAAEARAQGAAAATQDYAEGFTAFQQKRPPHFTGH